MRDRTPRLPRPTQADVEQADKIAYAAFEFGVPLETWQLQRLPSLLAQPNL